MKLFLEFFQYKLKPNFITELNVKLAFILSFEHTSQADICWIENFEKDQSTNF